MEAKAFKIITSQLNELFTSNGFSETLKDTSNSDYWQTIYSSNNKSFRLIWNGADNKYSLDVANIVDGETDDYRNISVWLFNPSSDAEPEAKSIAADFEDSAKDYIKGLKQPRAIRLDPKTAAKKKQDYMEFCRAACEMYPQFKDTFDAYEASSSEFNPDKFARETLGAYMMEMLSLKKNAQLKKLFEFYNQSYTKGDIDVQSIIMITLFGMFAENEAINEFAEKYINENILPIWKQVRKRMLKTAGK